MEQVELVLPVKPIRRPGDPSDAGTGPSYGRAVSRSALDRDRLDLLERLSLEVAGERCGTGGCGSSGLALFADDVAEVTLDQVSGCLVGVGRAGQQVGSQDDRVGARLLRGAVEVDRHVGVGTSLDARRHLDDLRGCLRGGGDELFADLHAGDTDVDGLAGVGIADGAGAALDGVNDAGAVSYTHLR